MLTDGTYHTFRKLDAEGVEHIVRVFQDPEPESPKHAYLNPVQENKPVLFVTAESSWNYTDAVMDVVYPSVGNSWEDLLEYAVQQLGPGDSAHWSHAPLWVHEHGGIVDSIRAVDLPMGIVPMRLGYRKTGVTEEQFNRMSKRWRCI